MSAAGAAVEVARQLHANLELWVSAGRVEGGGGILEAINAMIAGRPNVRLVDCGWQSWPRFRTTVRHMHLLLRPATPSHSSWRLPMVSKRACRLSSPTPSTGRPITGRRPSMMSNQMARVACYLLADPHAPEDGLGALERHNRDGLESSPGSLIVALMGVRVRPLP